MAGWGVSGFSGYVLCARMGNENNTRQELQRHSGGVSESCDSGEQTGHGHED